MNDLPFYNGEVLTITLPPIKARTEKGYEYHPLSYISFPEWVHDVEINNNVYQVLGKDLIVGMPIVVNGELFPIVSIRKHIFIGTIIPQNHPLGYKDPDFEYLPKYSFKRVVTKTKDRWIVKPLNPKSWETKVTERDKSFFLNFDKDTLVDYCYQYNNMACEILKELREAQNSLKSIDFAQAN